MSYIAVLAVGGHSVNWRTQIRWLRGLDADQRFVVIVIIVDPTSILVRWSLTALLIKVLVSRLRQDCSQKNHLISVLKRTKNLGETHTHTPGVSWKKGKSGGDSRSRIWILKDLTCFTNFN